MILFETLNQPYILILLIIFGFLSGFLFDFAYIISFLCNENKIVKNIFQFFAVFFSFFILFLLNLNINYGQFRVYIFVVFFFFLFIQRITVGKLIAKTKIWCYNTFKKLTKLILKVEENGQRKNKS